MGDIADMMLDGTLCTQCGEFLLSDGSNPAGYPVYCETCIEDEEDLQ